MAVRASPKSAWALPRLPSALPSPRSALGLGEPGFAQAQGLGDGDFARVGGVGIEMGEAAAAEEFHVGRDIWHATALRGVEREVRTGEAQGEREAGAELHEVGGLGVGEERDSD